MRQYQESVHLSSGDTNIGFFVSNQGGAGNTIFEDGGLVVQEVRRRHNNSVTVSK